MDVKRIPKRVILAYFSGTGCTKAVCDCFEEQLQNYRQDGGIFWQGVVDYLCADDYFKK